MQFGLRRVLLSVLHSRAAKVVNWGSHWSLTVPVSPWRFFDTMHSATFFSSEFSL